ncbi:hypothetical protein BH09VER1_BH09VER1_14280 [soil metagenome]
MKLIEPRYQLLDRGNQEWRFDESREMYQDTLRFDQIWESRGGTRGLASSLRSFLKDCPFHIDALHHYAMVKFNEGKLLDAYAFAQSAVAIGRNVFPEEFRRGRDRLPGGFTQNRPFLRAVHGLMLAQAALGDRISAVDTARELIGYDSEDRMGGRLSLPLYLLLESRDAEALKVFETPGFEDTFHTADFLKILALFRLGRLEEAKTVFVSYLHYHPQVIRFLLDPTAPPPPNDSPFGVTSGSEYEGWSVAAQYDHVLSRSKGAFDWLANESKETAARGWARYT